MKIEYSANLFIIFFPFPFGWFLIWKILKRNEFSSEKKSIWNYESKSKIPCSLPLRIHFDENEIKIGNRVHSRKAIRKKWTEKYEKNWRDNETKVIAKRRTFLVHFSANENRKKSIKNIILLDHFSWEVSNCLFSNVHIFISFLFILFRLSFDFMLFSYFYYIVVGYRHRPFWPKYWRCLRRFFLVFPFHFYEANCKSVFWSIERGMKRVKKKWSKFALNWTRKKYCSI